MPVGIDDAECYRLIEQGLKPTVSMHNLLTTVGKNLVRDMLRGLASGPLTQVGYGTGTTAPTVNDTALETEVAKSDWTSTVIAPASITFAYLMPAGSYAGTVFTEAGTFTAADEMFNRFVHTAITKTTAKQIFYQLVIDISEV